MAAALSCTFLSSDSTLEFRNSLKHTSLHCNNDSHRFSLSSSSSKFYCQKEGAVKKKHSKDERPAARSVLEPQPTSSKPFGFGIPRKNNKVKPSLSRDSAFLDAVVKTYCTHKVPDYSLPWQKQRQYMCKGSAFMIGDRKLLTNAHCVEHDIQVKVKKRGDDSKYVAKVLARVVDCDLALLSVESEEFWRDEEPLRLGHLPHLQDSVTVVGYPLGGDTISVTKGVVSRIEVTPYGHGASDLLGIQIDAAINCGNSGGPAFNDQGECIGVAFQALEYEGAQNIGYLIPTTVVSHFLTDYERNGRYTGFPCLGVLIQKLENPALRAWLKLQSNEGVLVRRVEPTSDANNVLKEGDVIVSIDDVRVGSEGTVPFRSNERIAFDFLISQKFAGDTTELGIIRAGTLFKTKVVLNSRVNYVETLEGEQPAEDQEFGDCPISDLEIDHDGLLWT